MEKRTERSLQWIADLDSLLDEVLEIHNGKSVITYPEQMKISEQLGEVMNKMNENKIFEAVPSLFSGAQEKLKSVISITAELIDKAARVN